MLEIVFPAGQKFLPKLLTTINSLSSLAFRGLFCVTNLPNVRSQNHFIKGVAVIFSIIAFLFFHPAIGAQTSVKDEVITLETKKAFVTISDSIGMTKLPDFSVPTHGYISTYFSSYHQGIDIPSPYGAKVEPVAEGEVVFAGWSPLGYGKLVTINHSGGVQSLYAHLSEINVKVGQKVASTDMIGRVGATGVATGAHLHLEVHLFGQPVNPLNYISLEKILGN